MTERISCPYNLITPTHRCGICGAYWRKWDDESWSLTSEKCKKCCDQKEMSDQIFELNGLD